MSRDASAGGVKASWQISSGSRRRRVLNSLVPKILLYFNAAGRYLSALARTPRLYSKQP